MMHTLPTFGNTGRVGGFAKGANAVPYCLVKQVHAKSGNITLNFARQSNPFILSHWLLQLAFYYSPILKFFFFPIIF